MCRSALVSGFVNISVYFNKLANNFKPLDTLFKRIKILLVIQLLRISQWIRSKAKIDGYNNTDNFLKLQTKGHNMCIYKLLLEILIEHILQ